MKHSKDPAVDRSLRHSVKDGMACSAMAGAGETYLSAFALLLKANASQVALLATLPPLLGALSQLLAAGISGREGRRLPLILLGAGFQACMWLAILALPLLFPQLAFPLLLGLATLYFAGGHFAAPLWISLMGDLVPERSRSRFFGRRTKLTTISSFAALVGGGFVLHAFDAAGHTVWGFVALFAFAFGARLLSVWHLSRMQEAPRPRQAVVQPRPPLGATIRGGAGWFSLYVVLMQGAVAISGPLFSVYVLRDLGLSYLQFMACTGAAVLIQFLTLNTWGRIGDAFGNRLILNVTSFSVPFVPALFLVSDHFAWLLLVQCLSGVSWAGFSLSTGNLLYELVPSVQRVRYAALHNVLTAGGIFAGGMLAASMLHLLPPLPVALGNAPASPLVTLFLVSSVARFSVAILLLRKVREIRRPRRVLSAGDFVYRVTRFNAFIGLAYELVCTVRPLRPAAEPDSRLAADRGVADLTAAGAEPIVAKRTASVSEAAPTA